MLHYAPQLLAVLKQPAEFLVSALKAFRANQGLLLAGAVAYYALLSIVPLVILIVIVLTHWVDEGKLLLTLGRYLEWVVPGQSAAIVHELASFLDHREVMGWVPGATMLFFSSLAFIVPQVGIVYGSLTTAIVVLLSLELGAALLLFGAQVISEYERTRRRSPEGTGSLRMQ